MWNCICSVQPINKSVKMMQSQKGREVKKREIIQYLSVLYGIL